jgi:hypothetical protein
MRVLFVLLAAVLFVMTTFCIDLSNVRIIGHLSEIDRFTITNKIRASSDLMASVQLAKAQNKTNSSSIFLDSGELKNMADTLSKVSGLQTNIGSISWESWEYFKGASVTVFLNGRRYFIILVKPNGTNWVVVDKQPFVGTIIH